MRCERTCNERDARRSAMLLRDYAAPLVTRESEDMCISNGDARRSLYFMIGPISWVPRVEVMSIFRIFLHILYVRISTVCRQMDRSILDIHKNIHNIHKNIKYVCRPFSSFPETLNFTPQRRRTSVEDGRRTR